MEIVFFITLSSLKTVQRAQVQFRILHILKLTLTYSFKLILMNDSFLTEFKKMSYLSF